MPSISPDGAGDSADREQPQFAMLDRSPHAVVVTEGPAHVVRHANAAFCRLAVATPEELVGRSFANVLPLGHGANISRLLDRVYQTGEAEGTANEGLLPLEVGAAYTVWPVMSSAGPTGLVVQAATITWPPAAKSASELQNANQRLLLAGLEAQEHALEAEEQLAVERARARQKENFLSDVAHDLKTPLTTMKGFTQLLLRRLDRGEVLEPGKTREDLNRIDVVVRRMSASIDDMLAQHRHEIANTFNHLVPLLDLSALVARIVNMHEITREDFHITFRPVADSVLGKWDGKELERVLSNLLSNAINYSEPDGEIEVRLNREEATAGPIVVLSVRDRGRGIPPDDLPHIFERHFRARNVMDIAGSGIGLAGVREIVERYGGTISAESTLNHGTIFSVRLPLGDTTQAKIPKMQVVE